MKNLLYTVLLSFIVLPAVQAQGIEFFHGTWAEALEKAKTEEKIIFVDAFASWCGPCKRMASQTFPDPEAGNYFNANFINMKIDMEKPENTEFAEKYPVGSYPTLMFIDAAGKVVLKEVGAKNVEQLIATGQKALGKSDKSVDFEKKYNEGSREPQLMYDYVRALNASGKPSLKITNEYLNSQKDLTTEFNLKFILEGTVDADSRVFDLLMKYQKEVTKLVGDLAVTTRIEKACRNTLRKAIEFKNESLLAETKAKMKSALPGKADAFACSADMDYFLATKDVKRYLKSAQSFQKSEIKNNAAQLHDLVIRIMRAFPEDKNVIDQAEKWAKTAAENGGLPEYYMTLAGVYKTQDHADKARAAALKAKELVGDKDENFKLKIDYFIESLQG
ncbi:MAG TPA: thioredoxin domain-containing protein [Saprospiraceae bacterium]|nr:thioredoxin domain-containing protein [Saprospiraceae bacterium]HPI05628.1 thioredoxin domain-containing protein [Saprospiraceae bacterium]